MSDERPIQHLPKRRPRRVPLVVRLFYPPKDVADLAKKLILFVIYFWPTLLYLYWH